LTDLNKHGIGAFSQACDDFLIQQEYMMRSSDVSFSQGILDTNTDVGGSVQRSFFSRAIDNNHGMEIFLSTTYRVSATLILYGSSYPTITSICTATRRHVVQARAYINPHDIC